MSAIQYMWSNRVKKRFFSSFICVFSVYSPDICKWRQTGTYTHIFFRKSSEMFLCKLRMCIFILPHMVRTEEYKKTTFVHGLSLYAFMSVSELFPLTVYHPGRGPSKRCSVPLRVLKSIPLYTHICLESKRNYYLKLRGHITYSLLLGIKQNLLVPQRQSK